MNGLTATVLGAAITSSELSGTATCPSGGPPTANTVVTNLSVLGTPIVGGVNASVDVQSAVTVTDLSAAVLHATVRTGIQNVTATTATATALDITFQLTGTTLAGGAVDVPVGTVTAGSAACLAPAPVAPAAPTASGLTPPQGPTTGGTTVTVTGTGFVPGATTVTIGGTTVPAGQVTVTSPTTLTFATPGHPAGPVQVTVTTPTGTTNPQQFLYAQSTAAAPVQTASPTGAQLAATGSPTGPLTGLAVLLLLTGAGLLLSARKWTVGRHRG